MIGSADLESTYADLSRTEYSWEELKVRPLPPGVDPAKIETYLSNDVFLVCISHNIFKLKSNFRNTEVRVSLRSQFSSIFIFHDSYSSRFSCYDSSRFSCYNFATIMDFSFFGIIYL